MPQLPCPLTSTVPTWSQPANRPAQRLSQLKRSGSTVYASMRLPITLAAAWPRSYWSGLTPRTPSPTAAMRQPKRVPNPWGPRPGLRLTACCLTPSQVTKSLCDPAAHVDRMHKDRGHHLAASCLCLYRCAAPRAACMFPLSHASAPPSRPRGCLGAARHLPTANHQLACCPGKPTVRAITLSFCSPWRPPPPTPWPSPP